jgi:DNA-binding beta-propeller fold protein YncE
VLANLSHASVTAEAGPTSAFDTAPLTVEARIPLGDIAGRIDHLAYDPTRGRLYVAELGNNTVGIVDLKTRRVMRRPLPVKLRFKAN